MATEGMYTGQFVYCGRKGKIICVLHVEANSYTVFNSY